MVGDADSKRPSGSPPRRPSTPPPNTRPSSGGIPVAGPSSNCAIRVPSNRPPPRISTSAALRLSSTDYDLSNAARRVIESALGVVRGERVALIVDRPRRDVGSALFEVTRTHGAEPIIHEMESFGERPLRQLPDALR